MSRSPVLAAVAASLLLTACSTTGGEPRVVTVEMAVPVASPCVPASLGPAPDYPDTDEALRRAGDPAERYQLVIAGRALKDARLNEIEPVVAACPKAAR